MRCELVALADALGPRLRVLTVYIAEAHAQEEWPVGDAHSEGVCAMSQHATLAQRRAAAELFVHELSWPFAVYVDGMADAFERTFAAWPLRFFLVAADGVTLAHVAQPTSGYTYSVADLRAAVEPLLAPSTR